jgi:hypothetical protein
VVSPDVQTWINDGKNLGQLPVNAKSSVDAGQVPGAGFEMLSTAEGGIAQFFDRDAPAEMAKVGMEGFQEFMVKPDQSRQHPRALGEGAPAHLQVMMRQMIGRPCAARCISGRPVKTPEPGSRISGGDQQ